MHDDMGAAGLLGDTEAIELIMKKLPAVGQANGCLGNVGPPHAAEKLRALTAHDAGDTAEGWHAWWREHEGKSQATLIRGSFKSLGIDPQKPPTKEQTLSLLRLIGLPLLLGSAGLDGLGASGFLGASPWAPWAWRGGVSLLAAGGVGGSVVAGTVRP